MSGGASGSNNILNDALDAGNPLHLQTNDNNNGSLINIKLIGSENYRFWATAMKIALQAKNNMCFVDEPCVKSADVSSVPLTNRWERCNVIVMSWLLSSIFEDLYLSQVYFENAAEKINNYKQNGLSVSEYYHKLNSLWSEFDILTKLAPYSCDAKAELGKHKLLMKLMQFLMDLDKVYQPIRSSLLTQTELPDVKDAFVIVCREESHRSLRTELDSPEVVSTMRSSRMSKLPEKLNDSVLDNKIKLDIAYVVHCLSQHMHSPLLSHFETALRVLRYLKSAPSAGIVYTKSSSRFVSAYADSDWAKCKMTRTSVSGYCVFVFGGLVSWKSKKQATLSRFSAET
ncbi:ribonuclease H-like domain-containing protein [Tanacetum coccineum]|uniref:Ribonuclease H-like domain-containing protein n=1 Tax=Tanacetum coccineum TaxID=301880 RepID=A0ABQ5DMC4_9ASTR